MNIRHLLESAESLRSLDRPATALQRALSGVLGRSRAADRALRGAWLGHPIHPMLVTLPIGAWTSAAVLDALPGQRDAARRLLAVGLLATPPAVATGWADWSELDVRQRRVGLLHALANVTAATCFLVSYQCRAHGAHRTGVAVTLVGLAPVVAAAALGGHVAYAQGAGVYRWQPGPDSELPASDTAWAGGSSASH